MIITDEYVKYDTMFQKIEFPFKNVESFRMISYGRSIGIGVNYRVGVKSWKDENMSGFAWWWTSVNKCGYDESFPVSNLSYDEDTILAMLNERLENSRKNKRQSSFT